LEKYKILRVYYFYFRQTLPKCPDQGGHQDSLALREGRALVAITVATAHLEHPENAGIVESRDQWDPRGPQELMALEVKEALWDLKD